MNIIVCIKQVPDVKEVKWDPETGSLIRKGVPSVINPNDKNAIEAALQLKEAHGGEVTILTMGPSQVEEALREALGMGADNYLIKSLPGTVGLRKAAGTLYRKERCYHVLKESISSGS